MENSVFFQQKCEPASLDVLLSTGLSLEWASGSDVFYLYSMPHLMLYIKQPFRTHLELSFLKVK